MESNLDRLEDRVQRAVRRIGELNDDRTRLGGDVEELKRRLAAAERKKSAAKVSQETAIPTEVIAREMQELIRELRDA